MRYLRPAIIGLLAVLLAIALIAGGGVPSAHAQPDCGQFGDVWVCIELTPKTASNPVGTTHTVTAMVTEGPGPSAGDQSPSQGREFDFWVDTGPNTGAEATGACDPADCKTDAAGVVRFTYADAARVTGTPDMIVGCHVPAEQVPVGQVPLGQSPVAICDDVDKDWYEPTPTPTPLPPTTAPTPTPVPVVLPTTGGEPPDGGIGGFAWMATIAVGATAVMIAGGLWIAYLRRRVR